MADAPNELPQPAQLRDYFAAAALTGLLAYSPSSDGCPQMSPKTAARDAYEIADAMLAAREKRDV